jgi:hypothetical protein
MKQLLWESSSRDFIQPAALVKNLNAVVQAVMKREGVKP